MSYKKKIFIFGLVSHNCRLYNQTCFFLVRLSKTVNGRKATKNERAFLYCFG